jgi:predicted flap endonuclease-1-like 5' DNA nuclease
MAQLKRAPGRIIGRWKADAIAANRGASDEDLAKIINEMAQKQGYDYTITPEKVRTKTKKTAAKPAAAHAAPAPAPAAHTAPAPAPRAAATGGLTLEDIRMVQGLIERIGADKVQELAEMLSD